MHRLGKYHQLLIPCEARFIKLSEFIGRGFANLSRSDHFGRSNLGLPIYIRWYRWCLQLPSNKKNRMTADDYTLSRLFTAMRDIQ